MIAEIIPGIDQQKGLACVRGNRSLYEKLLNKFHQQYHQTATELDTLIAAGLMEESILLVHSIKGVAGSLGAEALFEAAQQLEDALRLDNSRIHDSRKNFDAALKIVIEGLATTVVEVM